MSRKQRSLALTIFSATVILASSILGAALYSSEAASGGIEMKWRMNLYNGETYVCQFNDLTVVNDKDAKQLRFIDTDGNTVRNHQYMDFFGLEGYFAFSGDRFYYFDSYNGSRMLVCLGANGSTEWTLSDPRVSGVYAGADRNMYLQSQTPSLQANISNTVICIDGDGVQRWAVTESYAVGVWAICPDGTAILRHQVYSVDTVRANKTMEELISVSNDGTVLGKLNIPFQSDPVYEFVKQSTNGSIIISVSDYYATFANYTGFTKDLQGSWSMDSVQIGYGSGPVTYRLRNSTEIDGYGLQRSYTTLYAIDTANQSVIYETRFHGKLSLACINDGVPYVLDDTGRYWAVQPDGKAYGTNRTAGWIDATDAYGNGLLLINHAGVRLIGDHGDVIWQYLLDSGSATSVHVGTDRTILLVTDDGITAFHRPQVSMNMVYLMGLMAVDLLVALMTVVWIIDRRLPRSRDQ